MKRHKFQCVVGSRTYSMTVKDLGSRLEAKAKFGDAPGEQDIMNVLLWALHELKHIASGRPVYLINKHGVKRLLLKGK